LIIALTLGFLALWVASAPISRADGGNIVVEEVGAESLYPDGVRFFVTARSEEVIGEIRVFFKTIARATAGTYRAVEFEPGKLVRGESILRTSPGTGYIPPGTEIEYYFEVRDKGDAVHRTPAATFIYADTRFDWRTVTSQLVTVYYQGGRDDRRARTILNAAQEALDRMGPILEIDATEPVRVVAYHTYNDLASALPFRSRVFEGQIHTQGAAFGDQRVVLVHGADPMIEGVVSHEVTHLLVAEATGRASNRLPAWLSEGLAEYGNSDPGQDYGEALRRAIASRELRPLWQLSTFGGSADQVITAYGQGRSVVEHLVTRYGERKIAELMRAVQGTFNIDQALEQVYGFDVYGLDSEWRSTVGLEPLPRPERPEARVPDRRTPSPPPTPAPAQAESSSEPLPTAAATPTLGPAPSTLPATPAQESPATPATPVPTAAPSPVLHPGEGLDGGGGKPSPGCGVPGHPNSKGVAGDMALLALLAAPAAMLLFRPSRTGRRPRRSGCISSADPAC
jgi:hypothetical protein